MNQLSPAAAQAPSSVQGKHQGYVVGSKEWRDLCRLDQFKCNMMHQIKHSIVIGFKITVLLMGVGLKYTECRLGRNFNLPHLLKGALLPAWHALAKRSCRLSHRGRTSTITVVSLINIKKCLVLLRKIILKCCLHH